MPEFANSSTKWALVTGASSGIGREFCLHLANAGFALVLIARRRQLLEDLASQVKREHGTATVVVEIDLAAKGSAKHVRRLLDAQHIRVQLLVNNAASGQWGRFEQTDSDQYEEMVLLNDIAPVALCREFHPHLSALPKGAVINVSSQAAFQPVPFMAVYAASKSFLHHFSLALHEEWRKYGIYVQTLVPGPTATEFDKKAGAYESAVNERASPADAVNAALRHLKGDQPLVVSAKGVFMQRFFAGVFPTRIILKKVAQIFRPPDEK